MSLTREKIRLLSSLMFVFVVVSSLCLWIYTLPSPLTTLPSAPFALYYSKEEYTIQENGTATLATLSYAAVWFSSCNGASLTVMVREGMGDVQAVEINLLTGETNASGVFWWIPPVKLLCPVVSVNGTDLVVVGKCEEFVNQLAREAVILFQSDGENVSIAKYNRESGFLIDLKVKRGESVTVYRLQSALGAQLGVSKYYYLRVILPVTLIPSVAALLLSMPRVWRRRR